MFDFHRQLGLQSWILYGIGMTLISLRAYARWRRVRSLSRFAVDDCIMITAVPLLYTGLVVCLNLIATGGGSNLFPPEQLSTFTQADIDDRIKGSKIVVLSEQCMLNVIWCLKACMLFMYARILTGTSNMKWIKLITIWTISGWIAAEIAFFTACRPFKGYWAVPPPDPQCTTLVNYAIVQATFNLSSDLFIIAVPVPMILSLKLPLKQKIGLGALFSMGVFVIVAAILTKVYNLSNIYSTTYMLWYTREASVAVYVANLPGIWPLLREHIRFLREHTNTYPSGQSRIPGFTSQQYGNISHHYKSNHLRTFATLDSADIELAYKVKAKLTEVQDSKLSVGHTQRGTSQSSNGNEGDVKAGSSWKGRGLMGVQVDTRVEIQNDKWSRSGSRNGSRHGQSRSVWVEGPEAQAGRH
ncbi:hypothetical protein PTTW11_01300 [Pyrenophora teres f. teres]|uniref:Rhodopsin domain-containing protein n=1 Tax=Pyrenophora teres f. teres TaxID=97479 RepID=A0A6S6VB80_9PLEO|nr:hypothetical protein PTTW11_01300 [Pyrenophora teres f. teres]